MRKETKKKEKKEDELTTNHIKEKQRGGEDKKGEASPALSVLYGCRLLHGGVGGWGL